MQQVTPYFTAIANSNMRRISWQVKASFDKTFDPSIEFFTLDVSELDGPDLLAPDGDNIIQEWDKYAYTDYSSRVISVEVNRELTEPDSVVQAFADVTFRNDDNYFTPNSGSPIDAFILPRRPFRIQMGFGDENVPVFVGLSDKIPVIDKQAGTATFHLLDFLTFIFEQKVDETVMLQNYSTGEILDYLFQEVGLTPSQYVLDQTSFNRVSFFYVEKGQLLGPIIRELMLAEQGRLFMDELGVIRFLNRQNYSTAITTGFNKSNVLNYSVSSEDDVINFVKLTGDVLAEQNEQSIWEQSSPTYIPAGATVDVWASLADPATSITNPGYSETQVESSHFISTLDIEGTTPYTDIALDSISKFSKAVKMTFENTGSNNAYVYAIDLWGTPVRVEDTLIVEDFDQTSINALEERRFEYHSQYLQNQNNMSSMAAIMVDDYKDYGSIVDVDPKANPVRQIDDRVTVDLDGYTGPHVITKIVMGMAEGRFWQKLRLKAKEPRVYFVLDVSELDGTDVLAP